MIGFISEFIFKIFYPILIYFHKRGNYSDDAIQKKCGNIYPLENNGQHVIMFHGVSVGEVNAIEKLIKTTKTVFPESKIVVTTGTNTGQDIAQKKFTNVADLITYFPFDTPSCINRFLDAVKPDIIMIAETEIWPNISIECKKRGIKLCIINGRISDRTYNTYKFLKPFFKPLLNNYYGIYTQSTEDLNKFLSLGSNPNHTKRMNNLKFDITVPAVNFKIDKCGRILLAASTHSGEDNIVINVYTELKKNHKDLKLIIAPRHINRKDEVEELVGASGFTYSFRSDGTDSFANTDILILDTMGELGQMFAYADISFIGGSFNKTGGHNPLESVIFSKPVISGPSIHNFKDIYAIIKNAKAGFIVNSTEEFYNISNRLLTDRKFYVSTSRACENVFKSQQGALDFVINFIKETIN